MKTLRIGINVLIVALIFLQLLAYIGNWNKQSFVAQDADLLAYYIGFNLPLILSFILFVISGSIKRQLDKSELHKILESIGSHDKKKEKSLFV